MLDTNSGRWLQQDPIGFDAGDANLYRYVGNNPTNATDPSGLLEFAIQGEHLVMKVQFKLTWDMREKWTEERQAMVRKQLKDQIEQKWSIHPFVIRVIGDTRRANPQDKRGYRPKVEVAFVMHLPNKDDGWEIVIEPGSHELGRVKDNRMSISEHNVLKGQPAEFMPPMGNLIKFHQSTPAHEFGHLLGLDHPGFYVPQEFRGPDKESEYSVDTFAMMGNGEGMRAIYFAKWLTYFKERDKKENIERGTWVIMADETHPMFRQTADQFKHYQSEHKRFLPMGYGVGLEGK